MQDSAAKSGACAALLALFPPVQAGVVQGLQLKAHSLEAEQSSRHFSSWSRRLETALTKHTKTPDSCRHMEPGAAAAVVGAYQSR